MCVGEQYCNSIYAYALRTVICTCKFSAANIADYEPFEAYIVLCVKRAAPTGSVSKLIM